MAILTCKQTCECISLQIFSKYPIQKSRDRTNPPDLPTLKAYPTPGVGGRFEIFSPKWRERMNLKVPGAILPLGCAILSTRAKTVRGVGTTPLRRTRVKIIPQKKAPYSYFVYVKPNFGVRVKQKCYVPRALAYKTDANIWILYIKNSYKCFWGGCSFCFCLFCFVLFCFSGFVVVVVVVVVVVFVVVFVFLLSLLVFFVFFCFFLFFFFCFVF